MKHNQYNTKPTRPSDHDADEPTPPPKDARAILIKHGIGGIHDRLNASSEFESVSPPEDPKLEKLLSETTLDAKEMAVANLFFYDGRNYYMRKCFKFIPLDRGSVISQLTGMKVEEPGRVLNNIQTENFVTVVNALAGKLAGIHEIGDDKLLILKGPKIIQPKKGDFSLLLMVFEALLGNDPAMGEEQVRHLLLWLKTSLSSIENGVRYPAPALILAGPAGCGKSLLIELIVTILGGRRAHPNKFLTGRTTFNGELMGAEVLVSDDDSASTDARARRGVAAGYKNLLFAGEVAIEAKYAPTASYSPVWRLVVAVNDEPASMLVLPPITPDIEDKISLLKCHKRPLPMGPAAPADRQQYLDSLKAQIPALIHFLTTIKVPKFMRCARCGVTAVQHPDLLSHLKETPLESILLDLIDETLGHSKRSVGFTHPWEGTANELRLDLYEHCKIKSDVEKNFPDAQKVGLTLGKLANNGNRVERLPLLNGTQRWKVLPLVSIKEQLQARMEERREARAKEADESDGEVEAE